MYLSIYEVTAKIPPNRIDGEVSQIVNTGNNEISFPLQELMGLMRKCFNNILQAKTYQEKYSVFIDSFTEISMKLLSVNFTNVQ